jgi:hypothetical protein
MAKKEGTWTEKDQAKAAERGQGAEVGAAHGGESGRPGAADKDFAGSKPQAPNRKT